MGRPRGSLAGCPESELPPERWVYRIHRSSRGPWWFSCNEANPQRFDLRSPRGTCYVAEHPVGAFVEVFQDLDGGMILSADVDARRLSILAVPHPMRLADCTQARARAFDVTAEIHTTVNRDLTRDWAQAVAAEGFDGIRYFVRNDPAQHQIGIAIFGDAGEAQWPILATESIGSDLRDDVEANFGIRVTDLID